ITQLRKPWKNIFANADIIIPITLTPTLIITILFSATSTPL
ncbi:715_t:CDS:1, partial [Racocetra persica]